MKKLIIAVLAIMLVVCISIGATLAYLFVETPSVENTFEYGDINITLEETDRSYKMIPGNDIAKDPTVTVKANSEACYLFVKIEKSANFDNFMTYAIADGWTALTDETNVYYRVVEATETDIKFPVLKDNQVHVKEGVLKTELDKLNDSTKPTLTFTAYAVQKANVDDAAEAWAIAQNNGSNPAAN